MLCIIAACDDYNGIGKDGKLPWSCKKDMEFFQRVTRDSVVIMGKNTYLSIPNRPLKNRINIVITTSLETSKSSTIIAKSFEKALQIAKSYNKDIYFIGGKSIYQEALSYVDLIYITRIFGIYDCDVSFPDFPLNFHLINENCYDSCAFQKWSK